MSVAKAAVAAGGHVDARAYIAEARGRIGAKARARAENAAAAARRPDDDQLSRLDSTLKRNTAYVKRLRTLTESQRRQALGDFDALNLSKYVGEAAGALLDAKLKMADVQLAVDVCAAAHRRYADFGAHLLDAFRRALPRKKDERVHNASKLRVDLRLFAELVAVGVLSEKESLPVLGAALGYLVGTDKAEHQYLPIVAAFAKFCGEDYAGLAPKSVRAQADKEGLTIPTSTVFSAERRKNVHGLLLDYYESLKAKLLNCAADVKRMENRNRRLYQTKGEIHPDAVARLQAGRAELDKLQSQAANLCEWVEGERAHVDMESADDDGPIDMTTGMLVVGAGDTDDNADETDNDVWEDGDTKQFYTRLPELRQMLPGILYRDSERAELEAMSEKLDELAEASAANADEQQGAEGGQQTAAAAPDADAGEAPAECADEPADGGGDGKAADETEDKAVRPAMALLMDEFEVRLPTLINRQMIDDAAVDFVTNMNTKLNRRRLLKAIYGVRPTRTDLLPFYSRLAAVLQPVMPDLGTELVQCLLKELRAHIYHKNQLRLEAKLRCCRFVAELTKFAICPKSEALAALQRLLFDLRHHNIDMACALLESCGRYLYKSAVSHQKAKVLLEQMLRKKQASLNLDGRYALMIDNAYYVCNPPEGTAAGGAVGVRRADTLTPVQRYIEHIVFSYLAKNTVERALRELRCIDWSDGPTVDFALAALCSADRVRFANVEWLACLVAGLMWYHDWIGVRAADRLLENVRVGMELNSPVYNRKRLTDACYLAHLYNYRVVDSTVVFNALYSLVSFAVSTERELDTPFDPFTHVLRIRLCCEVLRHCGEYFDRGMSAQRLNTFWAYLQRYYWRKRSAPIWDEETFPFPLDIRNLIEETHDMLPLKGCKLFKSADEAESAVEEIENKYRDKVLSVVAEEKAASGRAAAAGTLLGAIAEDADEEEELFDDADDTEATAGGAALRHRQRHRDDDSGGEQHNRSDDERSETGSSSASDADEEDEYEGGSLVDEADDEYAEHDDDDEDDFDVTVRDEAHVDQHKAMEEASALDQMIQQMVTVGASERPHTSANVPADGPAAIEIPANVRLTIQRRARFADDEPAEGASAGSGHDEQQTSSEPEVALQQQHEHDGAEFSMKYAREADGGGGTGPQQRTAVPFALITRGRQSKMKLKTFKVSEDSALAENLRQRQLSEQAEKEKVKQLTLYQAGRQEAEELAELQRQINASSAPLPHGPRTGAGGGAHRRFAHQKGAPALSSIFASDWQQQQ